MEFDWKFLAIFLPSVLSAASGLGGVLLGSKLTSRREVLRDAELRTQELSYLAILMSAHLDQFVERCLAVSFDDGTRYGAPSREDGTYEPTEDLPEFEPLKIDVKWKILPPDLLYGILNLPYKVEQMRRYTNNVSENDHPPDYADFFHARQVGFARIGIEAMELAQRLRARADLPPPPARPGGWDLESTLRERAKKFSNSESFT